MPKVTIKEIAEKAGVSITSVSFAFNDPNRIGKDTVQKILEVADELGYTPDPIARSMTTGKTGTLGILLPQPLPEMLSNPFLLDFLEGVGETCTTDGYSLMLVPPLQGSIRRAIENAAVDGFITIGLEQEKSAMKFIRQRGVPFVTVDTDPVEGIPAINVDDENGAVAIMDYILAQGHRKIAIVGIRSGKEGRYLEYVGTLKNRMNGFRTSLRSNNLDFDSNDILFLESKSTTLSGGEEVLEQIQSSSFNPTAIITMSDIIAVGIMSRAKELGIKIPEEYSITGFDDIPLARLVTPPLTTISQPICKKGKTAADILVNLIQGNEVQQKTVLPTKLIIRNSVRDVAAD